MQTNPEQWAMDLWKAAFAKAYIARPTNHEGAAALIQAAFAEREARLVESLRHVTDCLVVELGNLANEDETDDADLQGILGSKYARQVIAARLRIRQARATLAALKDRTHG